MTEKDKQQEKDQQQDSTPQVEVTEPQPTGGDGGNAGSGLSILALLISLGAAAGAGWLWFHQQGANVAVNQTVSKVEQGQKEAGEKLIALSTEFNSQKNQTANAFSKAASRQSALENSVKQIYVDISNNRDVWKLEEVDQLLTVAGERMQLANDQKTALAALQLADKRLATMGDPALLPLREKVSDAISKLKSVGEDDVSGVALKIRSLIKNVDTLPFDYDRKPEKSSMLVAPVKIYAAEEAAISQLKADATAPKEQALPEVKDPEVTIPEVTETATNIEDVADSGDQQAPATADEVESTSSDNVATEEAVPNQTEAPETVAEPVSDQSPEPAPEPESTPVVETPSQPEPAQTADSAPEAAPASSAKGAASPTLQKLKEGASQFFDELWGDTKKAFDYQVLDRAAKPLLTPDQKYFVTENVKLALSAAQLAALQGDETTYKDNLTKAREWVGKYFAADDPRVQTAVETIADLEKVDVSPEWPDISGVLQELRVIKERKAGQ